MEDESVVPVESIVPVESAAAPLESAVPVEPAAPLQSAVPVEPAAPMESEVQVKTAASMESAVPVEPAAVIESTVLVEPAASEKTAISEEPAISREYDVPVKASLLENRAIEVIQDDDDDDDVISEQSDVLQNELHEEEQIIHINIDDLRLTNENDATFEKEDLTIEASNNILEQLKSHWEFDLMDELESLSSWSEDESFDLQFDYLKRAKISVDQDFLNDLGRLQSMSLMSFSMEKESSPEEADTLDLGQFLNPLTGESLSSTSSKSIQGTKDSEGSDTDERDQGEDFVELSELHSEIFESDHDESVHIDFADIFKRSERKDSENDSSEDLLKSLEREHKTKIQVSTEKLVRSLADKAVDKTEGRGALILTAAKIDKVALLQELYDDINKLLEQKRLKEFLNMKAADSYRRKKQFKPLKKESSEEFQPRYRNFVTALNELDFKLLKEHSAQKNNAKILETERMKLEESEEAFKKAEQALDEQISNTLIRPHCSPQFKMFVEEKIKKIHEKTLETGMARRNYIRIAHKKAFLMEAKQEIEQIEPGITMTNHLYAIVKTAKVKKRIDELKTIITRRSEEYKKLLHFLAHTREELWIYNMLIEDNNDLIQKLKDKVLILEKKQNSEKLKKVALQDKLLELEQHVGLLARPLLMHDYDQTMVDLKASTQTLERLRMEHERVRRRSELRRSNVKK